MLARFRDPLMHAAYDLQSRIYNILKKDFVRKYYTDDDRQQSYLQDLAKDVQALKTNPNHGKARLIKLQITLIDLLAFLDPGFLYFPEERRTKVVDDNQTDGLGTSTI